MQQFAHARKAVTSGCQLILFVLVSYKQASATLLHEHLVNDLHWLPSVWATDSFPYRSDKGTFLFHCSGTVFLTWIIDAACLFCETESGTRHKPDEQCCRRCSNTPIANMSGPELLQHMGSHILHDPHLKDTDNPCGFCLSTGDCAQSIWLNIRRLAAKST